MVAVVALVGVQHGSAGHAHSFAYYHGPVVGPGHELSVYDKHGHHQVDYAAYPKYEFAYGVKDHYSGDYHGQTDERNGNNSYTTILLRVCPAYRSWKAANTLLTISIQAYENYANDIIMQIVLYCCFVL